MALLASVESLNRIGALVAHAIYVSCIFIFCARLAEKPRVEHWLGLLLMLALIPLTCLLVTAQAHARPPLYYVQVSLMIVFLIVELLLDYVLRIPFRQEQRRQRQDKRTHDEAWQVCSWQWGLGARVVTLPAPYRSVPPALRLIPCNGPAAPCKTVGPALEQG